MAITENRYTGDGTTTTFPFVFPYIDETDIKVTKDDVLVPTNEYSLANATTILFGAAPAIGEAIRIYRDTDDSANKATFFAGSAVRSQDLNDNFLQALYLSQEAQTISTSISEGGLTENSITGFHLANDSVGADQILAGAVDTAELADGAVTTVKLDDLAVTDAKIADSTITGTKLANSTVSETKLGNDAVSTIKIQDDAVTSPKIADGTIVEGNLADGAVTSAKILDGTIVNVDVSATAAIAGTKIAPNFGSQNISTTGGGEFATLKNPSSASNNITLNADGSTEFNNLTLSGAGVTESGGVAHNVETTGIPSWAKRIHVSFVNVAGSTTGGGFWPTITNPGVLQIGNSSGFITTNSYAVAAGGTYSVTGAVPITPGAASSWGIVTLVRYSSNQWVISASSGDTGGNTADSLATISFTGPLDRIRLIATAGTYNVIYDA